MHIIRLTDEQYETVRETIEIRAKVDSRARDALDAITTGQPLGVMLHVVVNYRRDHTADRVADDLLEMGVATRRIGDAMVEMSAPIDLELFDDVLDGAYSMGIAIVPYEDIFTNNEATS